MRYYKHNSNNSLNEGGIQVSIKDDQSFREIGSIFKKLRNEFKTIFNFTEIPVKFGISINNSPFINLDLRNNDTTVFNGGFVGTAIESYFISVANNNINRINAIFNKEKTSIANIENHKARNERKGIKTKLYKNFDYAIPRTDIKLEIKTSHIRPKHNEIEFSKKQYDELNDFDIVLVIFYKDWVDEENPNSNGPTLYIKPIDLQFYTMGYLRQLKKK